MKESKYRSPENSSGRSEVEWAPLWVCVHSLLDKLRVFNLISLHYVIN